MFYIYIIYSETSDKFYVGYSSNPWKRVVDHNENSIDKYTGKHGPWILQVVFQVSESRSEAMKIEKFIKKQKNRKLIERLINPEFIPTGPLAELVRVPYLRD